MEKLPVNNILINNMKRIRDSDKLTNILYVFKKNSSENISKKNNSIRK